LVLVVLSTARRGSSHSPVAQADLGGVPQRVRDLGDRIDVRDEILQVVCARIAVDLHVVVDRRRDRGLASVVRVHRHADP
jgi:hypothetical protein